MDNIDLVPKKYHCLSGSGLKIIAVITMLIDHIGAAFPRYTASVILHIGSKRLMLYTVMRFIGRISFPIYAFLLVEGFLHTHDRRKYGLRLFLFALLSELPWNYLHAGTWQYAGQNVFFTLVFGYFGLCLLEQITEDRGERWQEIAMLLGLLVATVVFQADYGCSGFGFILMLYLLRQQPLFRAVVGACFLSSRWQAGFAFLPIGLYNGKRGFIRGRAASILFYAIYPVHMLILYWIKKQTTGF